MAYNIPGVTQGIRDGVVELWDAILHGMVRITDPTKITLEDGTGGVAKFIEVEVNCSAGGTAQTSAIGTIPANSIILDVSTYCTVAFNGDATKTFEVGIVGNTDKYIDPVDCGVTLAAMGNAMGGTNNDQKKAEAIATATALIATWTNTASATAGKMKVKVVYV